MKALGIAVIVVAIAVALFVTSAFPPSAEAQQQPAAWEYGQLSLREDIGVNEGTESWSWREGPGTGFPAGSWEELLKHVGAPTEVSHVIGLINHQAQKGWDLVQFDMNGQPGSVATLRDTRWLFRRPRR